MSQSPRLKLSYILPQQAQKHVSANESFRRLDALVQLSVKSAALAAEPPAPAEGDAYIVPAGATGASWSAFAAGVVAAFQDGQWLDHAPRAGWRASPLICSAISWTSSAICCVSERKVSRTPEGMLATTSSPGSGDCAVTRCGRRRSIMPKGVACTS